MDQSTYRAGWLAPLNPRVQDGSAAAQPPAPQGPQNDFVTPHTLGHFHTCRAPLWNPKGDPIEETSSPHMKGHLKVRGNGFKGAKPGCPTLWNSPAQLFLKNIGLMGFIGPGTPSQAHKRVAWSSKPKPLPCWSTQLAEIGPKGPVQLRGSLLPLNYKTGLANHFRGPPSQLGSVPQLALDLLRVGRPTMAAMG